MGFRPEDGGHDSSTVDGDKATALANFAGYDKATDHPAFGRFKERVRTLFTQLDAKSASNAATVAEQVWNSAFSALRSSAGRVPQQAGTSGRADLNALRTEYDNKAESIIGSFAPIEASVQGALHTQFTTARHFAFWSGQPAKQIAKGAGADLALESSALGGLFDGINVAGDWDIQMWAALSTFYAQAIVKYARGKEVRVFVSPAAPRDNIYTNIEFPVLKTAFERCEIQINNYPCVPKVAWNPDKGEVETMADTPSPAYSTDGLTGVLSPIPGGSDAIAARSRAIDAADAAKQAQVDAAAGSGV